MLTGYWSKATARPIPNTASPHPGEAKWLHEVAGKFTAPPLGWCLHVVVGNGSPYDTFVGAKSPSRRFSTGWVAKDGHAEMYAPLDYKSWAQGSGNPLYWSWETEGFPNEPLTDAQIDTLARWHVFSGTIDRIADTPGEKGIIVHSAGGAAWGGHSCPDPAPGAGPRSKQRAAIIARAQQLRTGDNDMTTDESVRAIVKAEVAAALTTTLNGPLTHLVESVWAAHGSGTTAWKMLQAAAAPHPPIPAAGDIAAAIAAQLKSIPAGTATIDADTVAEIAGAVRAELAKGLAAGAPAKTTIEQDPAKHAL